MKNIRVLLILVLTLVFSTTMAFADTEEEFVKCFIRENMSAEEMLKIANENLLKESTYKFKGINHMTTKTEAQDQESIMNMELNQEGITKNPNEVYVKTTFKTNNENMPMSENEVYTKDNVMYMKMGKESKWTKMNMNPMMEKMKKIMGSNGAANGVMSQEQMDMFATSATFDKDEVVDGKTYYVVDMSISQGAYKKMVDKIIKEMMNSFTDMATSNADKEMSEEEIAASKAQVEAMINNVLENMKMKVTYKFYIDPETKMHTMFKMMQNVSIDMEGTSVLTESKGEYTYYDFNAPVSFPELNEEEVVEFGQMLKEEVKAEEENM